MTNIKSPLPLLEKPPESPFFHRRGCVDCLKEKRPAAPPGLPGSPRVRRLPILHYNRAAEWSIESPCDLFADFLAFLR
jgi:hypothetical protein